MMNTRNCAIHFDTRTIIVTKSFLKEAEQYQSMAYCTLTALTREHPNFRIEVKQSYRGKSFMPTYEEMLTVIHRQSNAEELLAEFEDVRSAARMTRNAYMTVRGWFILNFGAKLHEGRYAA